jgi:hypothetical protein
MPAADAPLVQVTTDDKLVGWWAGGLVGWWEAFDARAVSSSSVRKDSFVEVDNVCRCRRRTAGLKQCAAIARRIYEPRQRPMTERSSFTIGWPVTGRSRRLNVRATTHVNGRSWPISALQPGAAIASGAALMQKA